MEERREEENKINVIISIHGAYNIDSESGSIEVFTTPTKFKSLHLSPINYSPFGFQKLELLFILLCKLLKNVPIEMIYRIFNDNTINKHSDVWHKISHPTSTQTEICDKLYEFFNVKYLTTSVRRKYYSYDLLSSAFIETSLSYSDDIVEKESLKVIYTLGSIDDYSHIRGVGIFTSEDFILEFKDSYFVRMKIVLDYLENTGLIFSDYTKVERKTANSIVLRYSTFQNIMQCKYYIAWSIYREMMKESRYWDIFFERNIEEIHKGIFNILTSHLVIEPDAERPGHSKILEQNPLVEGEEDYRKSFLCYTDDTSDFQIADVNHDEELKIITPDTEPFSCINSSFRMEDLKEVFNRERYDGNSKVFGLKENSFIKPYMDTMRACIAEDAARRPPGENCFNTFLTDLQDYTETTAAACRLLPEDTNHYYTKIKILFKRNVATLFSTTNENIINFITSNRRNSLMIFDRSCAYVYDLPEEVSTKVFDFDPDPRIARGKTRKKRKSKKRKSKKRKSKRKMRR
jgi:hypothetical protein